MIFFTFIAPTPGPLNIQVSNTSSTSLGVTWVRPPPNETHGVIRQYDIRYQRVDCSSSATALSNWAHETVDGSILSTDITNLVKWSCYTIQIRAVTIKDGVWSNKVQQRTSEDGIIIYLHKINCKSLQAYPERFSLFKMKGPKSRKYKENIFHDNKIYHGSFEMGS